jgi:hypothetical protein
VLGWTPGTVMREASLIDLLDAWEGYAAHHNIKPRSPVSRQFLDEMLKKFDEQGVPDGAERRPQ